MPPLTKDAPPNNKHPQEASLLLSGPQEEILHGKQQASVARPVINKSHLITSAKIDNQQQQHRPQTKAKSTLYSIHISPFLVPTTLCSVTLYSFHHLALSIGFLTFSHIETDRNNTQAHQPSGSYASTKVPTRGLPHGPSAILALATTPRPNLQILIVQPTGQR